MRKNLKIVISLIMSVVMLCSVIVLGAATTSAGNATGVGLSAYALNAYNEQWDYVWGGITPGAVDCTGLVYSYYGVGGIRTDMLSSSSDWGYVSNGIPRIHGLGLHLPGHVGVYVGSDLEVDARSTYDDMCYGSVWDLGWVEWFKVYGVEYPTSGWVKFNGNSFYYEDGQYVVSTSRTIDGVTYNFNSKGYSDTAPDESAYEQTDYSGSSSSSNSNSSNTGTSTTSKYLKNGSSGEKVKDLQTKLQALGYFDEGITGYFGDYTEEMLIEFQKDANIEVDGVAGPEVFDTLDSDDAPTRNTADTEDTEDTTEATTAAPKAEPKHDKEAAKQTVEETTEPTTIEATTEVTTAEITTAELTTEATTEEITAAPTTIPDTTAIEAMTEPDTMVIVTEPAKADDGTLRFGDANDKITDLQNRFAELRYTTAEATGIFDNATLNALHSYLAASELSQTDEISQELYSMIMSTSAVISPDYNNLQNGYTGTDVKDLNAKLMATGYLKSSSAATSYFDNDTENAVKDAQSKYNMEQTGIANMTFRQKLDSEYASLTTASESASSTDSSSSSPTRTTSITRTSKIGNKALDTVDDSNAVTNVVSTSDTKAMYQILICVAALMLAVSITATFYFIIDKKRKACTSRTRIK